MSLERIPCGWLRLTGAGVLVLVLTLAARPSFADQAAGAPAPPRSLVEIPPLPSGGRAVTVPPRGDLQAALDAARPGDTIVLEAGATYVGPFTLPNKEGAGWVTLRSSRLEQGIPAAGTRVGPQHADAMPKLVSRSKAVIIAAPGAHHYRFVGIEIRPVSEAAIEYGLVILGNMEPAPDQVPHHIIVERSYLHGDPEAPTRRGIALNGADIAVVDSYLADFKDTDHDSQALCGWNGPGPFKIENNYLEAAGENVMFGGSPPAIRGLIPSDIEIRRNHFAKPLAWKSKRWAVKNLFELKNARRVLVDGNLLEHNWASAQSGFAVLFTVRGEDGQAPWAVIEDVTFTNNVVRDSPHGLNILARDDGGPSGVASRILIRNNLITDIGARLFQVLRGPANLVIEHNTAFAKHSIAWAAGEPTPGFVLRNNVITLGDYGIIGDGTPPGSATLTRYFPGAVITGNALLRERGANPGEYPGNTVMDAGRAGFVAAGSGDWRLRADSALLKREGDGKGVGVDFTELLAALKEQAALAVPGRAQ